MATNGTSQRERASREALQRLDRGARVPGAIKNIKKGAIIINCARGGLIDENALVEALETGQLFSAGLDTFSKEPPDNASLLEPKNTVISPHCAGATLDNFDDIAERAITNIKLFLRDETIPREDIVYDPR